MKLFGSSGIRGKFPEEISPEFCYEIGKAIGTNLPDHSKIVVATDTRLTRDVIKTSLVSGLMSVNVNVDDLNIIPTSILAYIVKKFDYDGGVMITASHNPPDFNGIKLWDKNGMAYSKNMENDIEIEYYNKKYNSVAWNTCGKFETQSTQIDTYIEDILSKINIQSDFKVLIDPGNGATSHIATSLFKEAGLQVESINDTFDGNFPNRNPEPKEETLKETISILKKKDFDIAICFDGDGDRVVFCDQHGFIGYNEAISFIARCKILNSKNTKVATTVETGYLLDKSIEDIGGTVIRGMVGDGNVAYLTKNNKATIGIEQVGHYIIPEIGYHPDVFYPALFLLENIDKISDIRDYFKKIPALYYLKKSIDVQNSAKYEIVNNIGIYLDNLKWNNVNSLDGIRIEFEDSWVLIRASGTQPMIRIIVESENNKDLNEHYKWGVELVKKFIKQGAT